MAYNDAIEKFQKFFGWSHQVTVVEYSANGQVHSHVTGFAVDSGRVSARADFSIEHDRYYPEDPAAIFITLYKSQDDWFNKQSPTYRSYRTYSDLTIDANTASWDDLADGTLRVLHGAKRGDRWDVDIFFHGRPTSASD